MRHRSSNTWKKSCLLALNSDALQKSHQSSSWWCFWFWRNRRYDFLTWVSNYWIECVALKMVNDKKGARTEHGKGWHRDRNRWVWWMVSIVKNLIEMRQMTLNDPKFDLRKSLDTLIGFMLKMLTIKMRT